MYMCVEEELRIVDKGSKEMTTGLLRCDVSGGVAVITIDNPPANALNSTLMLELMATFGMLHGRRDVLAVVLTAAGTRFFMGGADIRELLTVETAEEGTTFSAKGHEVMRVVEEFDRPVIAAVNGFALGGGCELAMACDIRIAAESARFGQPEANLGVIPGAGGTQRLPRLVGKGKAKEIMMTGDIISAQEALRIGLVERVVPDTELLSHSVGLAQKIAAKGPAAIRLIKKATNEGMEMPLAEGLRLETSLFGQACAFEDKKEGVNAFLERRSPAFLNK